MNSSIKNLSPKKKKISNNLFLPSNIITTPYEKVLSILKQIKKFISNFAKDQVKLIQSLDWCIKIITSRSLYSYELKEKDTINKLSKDNPDFKQLVDFVSEYNEKVIQMNRKYNSILTDKLLQKSSTKLNRRRIERKSSFLKKSEFYKLLQLEEINKQNKNESNKNKDVGTNKKRKIRNSLFSPIKDLNSINIPSKTESNIKNENNNPFTNNNIKKKINLKKNSNIQIDIVDENNINKTNDSSEIISSTNINKKNKFSSSKTIQSLSNSDINNKLLTHNYSNKKPKNTIDKYPSIKKISININYENDNEKNINNSSNIPRKPRRFNSIMYVNSIPLTNSVDDTKKKKATSKSKSKKNIPHILKEYSYGKIQNKLMYHGYDISKLITEKNFDIFELKDLIGYNNVLPLIGRTILDNLGLLDEEILNISKLDNFLVSVSNQYKPGALYHNALHGSDVTLSVYLFFSHSNAEKVAKTNVLDLLSIIIGALGHDIGHPGLTNTFHINYSTEMAITYNDISVLENFHASTLFKIVRKTENNIFEKLTTIDYKIIRKRMISEILATDMANHGKVMSLFKSKILLNDENNEYKLNLLTENAQIKIEEQQSLLDFMIHLADLAHNTKLFDISKKWVELLSEEYWRQGDLEKEKNLPVSFLCDRNDINIPQSQKGFISGYIIPTFECLVSVFPTLRFTLDNANNNLKEWQKLLDEKHLRGWTPPKNEVNLKKNHYVEENLIKSNYVDINLTKSNKVKKILFNSLYNQKKIERIDNKKNDKNKNTIFKINIYNQSNEKSRNYNNSLNNNSNNNSNSNNNFHNNSRNNKRFINLNNNKRRFINNTIDITLDINNGIFKEINKKNEKKDENKLKDDSKKNNNIKKANQSNSPKKFKISSNLNIFNKSKEKVNITNISSKNAVSKINQKRSKNKVNIKD